MRLLTAVLAGAVTVGALIVGVAAPASAHVLPTTSVVLDVRSASIDAELRIPASDLAAASGIDLGDATAADVASNATAIEAYIAEHFTPTSDDGTAWTVTVDGLAVTSSEQAGTGEYAAITATAHLMAPSGESLRAFDLGYDAVIERVITHVVIVSVRTDWTVGAVDSARQIGTIRLDTASGTVPTLHVDLGNGSDWQGFVSMVTLGMDHIRDGTDHQLFLLTLLLPAPLLARARRWAAPVGATRALRRIGAITLAFTLGHSVTLALGALGLPAPQQVVEALIAVSILVAAVHAIRPIFAGREVLIAAGFGLVHGLAFSATLSELQLTGEQLVLSLLGFNLGIEIMQLIVVALVLPPLIVISRTGAYRPLRVGAAIATGVAAVGWLLDRIGVANPVASVADGIEPVAIWIVAMLWVTAVASVIGAPRRLGSPTARRRSVAGRQRETVKLDRLVIRESEVQGDTRSERAEVDRVALRAADHGDRRRTERRRQLHVDGGSPDVEAESRRRREVEVTEPRDGVGVQPGDVLRGA